MAQHGAFRSSTVVLKTGQSSELLRGSAAQSLVSALSTCDQFQFWQQALQKQLQVEQALVMQPNLPAPKQSHNQTSMQAPNIAFTLQKSWCAEHLSQPANSSHG
jgi:hypothetical protein